MSPKRGSSGYRFLQTRAARLVADDVLTDQEIADTCGINKRTLERWKQLPSFAAAVVRFGDDLAAAELADGIADRQRRVSKLDRTLDALEQIVAERAADASMAPVPGGATGWLVRQYRMVGMGKAAQLVEEYTVDVGTSREMRALMEQAAKELGQWTERRELTGKDGGPVHVDLTGLSDDELAALERARSKLDAAGS